MPDSFFNRQLGLLQRTLAAIDLLDEYQFDDEVCVLRRLAADHCRSIFHAFSATCVSGAIDDTPRWFYVGGPWHGAFLWPPQGVTSDAEEYVTTIVGLALGSFAAWTHTSTAGLRGGEADLLAFDAMVKAAQDATRLGEASLAARKRVDLRERRLPNN